MKSTLQKLLYLTVFCTLFINKGYTQISKQQAITFVMDSIVGVNTDSVNVYMEENLQSSLYYIISPFDSINATYSSYWLFFIDDQPEYLWGISADTYLSIILPVLS